MGCVLLLLQVHGDRERTLASILPMLLLPHRHGRPAAMLLHLRKNYRGASSVAELPAYRKQEDGDLHATCKSILYCISFSILQNLVSMGLRFFLFSRAKVRGGR